MTSEGANDFPDELPTPAEWEIVSDLFQRCSALPAAEQEAFLSNYDAEHPKLTGYVRAMCDADSFDAAASDALPQQIGAYRLGPLLGQGGMGAVYQATRVNDDFEELVAIKIMRTGFQSETAAELFRRERLILSQLKHECIARLLDGGSFGKGIPYLVMELIHGAPIVEYCERESLSIERKLRMFQRVCEAVQYAHNSQVVHCDITPHNILVDEHGVPKLLDFGVAKLLNANQFPREAESEPGGFTAQYASPEQKRNEFVTAATDVYSMTLVLRDLLTRARQDERPLSKRPELESILSQGTDPSPGNRYASPAALSQDVENYLQNRPVSAHPRTTLYVARKFIRRNTLTTAISACLVLLLTATAIWATRQTLLANRRYYQLRQRAEHLLFEMPNRLANVSRSTSVRASFAEEALNSFSILADEAQKNSLVSEELAVAYETLGDLKGNPASQNLGETNTALNSFMNAIQIRRQIIQEYGATPVAKCALASDCSHVGVLHRVSGNLAKADEYLAQSMRLYTEVLRAEPGNRQALEGLAETKLDLGRVRDLQGKHEEAAQDYADELAAFEKLKVSGNIESNRNLSLAYRMNAVTIAQRDPALSPAAEAMLQKSLSIDEGLRQMGLRLSIANGDRAQWFSDHGAVCELKGDLAGAEVEYTNSLHLRMDLEIDDPEDMKAQRFLAQISVKLGRVQAKEGSFDKALRNLGSGSESFEHLARRYPENAMFLAESADAYTEWARAELRKALAIPDRPLKYASFAGAEKLFEVALQKWREVSLRSPGNLQATAGIERAMEGIDACQRAGSLISRVKDRSNRANRN